MSLTDASSNPITPFRISVTTGVQAVTFRGCVSGSSAMKSLMTSTASLTSVSTLPVLGGG